MNSYPIYRFVSLRSPNSNFSTPATHEVEYVHLDTEFIEDLTDIVESNSSPETKLTEYNDRLQDYVDSAGFIRTKRAFHDLSPTPSAATLEILYDNIVVRTLTKSVNNQLFKLLIDRFKEDYETINSAGLPVEISIPESITPDFIGFRGENEEREPEDPSPKSELLERLNELCKAEELLLEAEKENVTLFSNIGVVIKRNLKVQNLLSFFGKNNIDIIEAKAHVDASIADLISQRENLEIFNREIDSNTTSTIKDELRNNSLNNIATVKQLEKYRRQILDLEDQDFEEITDTIPEETDKYDLLFALIGDDFTIETAFSFVKEEIREINKQLKHLLPKDTYKLVGTNWVNVSDFGRFNENIDREVGNSILNLGNICALKFPYQVADLRVVETEPVGYLPGEIAHINNTQAGEKHTRETRRLKRTETFESYIIDEESFRETDTQSTEKFSLENVSSAIQAKANELSVYSSASGKFGPVTASVDVGYSNSNSTINSSVVAQKEAKEVFEQVVDRVSKRVKSERSTLTIEEFEEKVIHEIDNGAEGTKSYVYRWLNKLVRGTLKNYGKRLMFEIDIVHPSHYFLSRTINKENENNVIEIPKDPRKASIEGNDILTIDNITRDNYLVWANLYKVEIEQPPIDKIIVSEGLSGTQSITTNKMVVIPDDYACYTAKVTLFYYDYLVNPAHTMLSIGLSSLMSIQNGDQFFWNVPTFWLSGETKQVPVSISSRKKEFYANIEIECHLTSEAYKAWKIKTYNALVAAYEDLVKSLEEKQVSFDPNNPGINPLKKEQLIKEEIKREAIRKMFRCNPFWLKDNYIVGKEYNPICCFDGSNAELVKFIETTFDWENMTYQLHPYFYSDKNSWNELLSLEDDDPHFEAFMKASYATVRLPVHRDELKERAAINFLQFNSIANYDVVPAGISTLLDELKDNQPTKFEYDINGEKLPAAVDTIDLGVFKVPTDLVILECGNRDGIKPIGFPEADLPDTDVSIPRQYSPAIIADSCDGTMVTP